TLSPRDAWPPVSAQQLHGGRRCHREAPVEGHEPRAATGGESDEVLVRHLAVAGDLAEVRLGVRHRVGPELATARSVECSEYVGRRLVALAGAHDETYDTSLGAGAQREAVARRPRGGTFMVLALDDGKHDDRVGGEQVDGPSASSNRSATSSA